MAFMAGLKSRPFKAKAFSAASLGLAGSEGSGYIGFQFPAVGFQFPVSSFQLPVARLSVQRCRSFTGGW
jgi:hypothetical protein